MRIQQYRKYVEGSIIKPERTTFTVPTFTLDAETWAASSNIIAEFPFLNTATYFSLKLPVTAFGENFVAAVRWVVDDIVTRFVFWEDDLAVLYFPIYNGEQIGLNAVLEIWSVNSTDDPTLDEAEVLSSSVLVFPEDTCNFNCLVPGSNQDLVQRTPVSLPPSAFCNPFCNNLCG